MNYQQEDSFNTVQYTHSLYFTHTDCSELQCQDTLLHTVDAVHTNWERESSLWHTSSNTVYSVPRQQILTLCHQYHIILYVATRIVLIWITERFLRWDGDKLRTWAETENYKEVLLSLVALFSCCRHRWKLRRDVCNWNHQYKQIQMHLKKNLKFLYYIFVRKENLI